MGKLALAAKVTHVPSMYLSELPGKHQAAGRPRSRGTASSASGAATWTWTPSSCWTCIGWSTRAITSIAMRASRPLHQQ